MRCYYCAKTSPPGLDMLAMDGSKKAGYWYANALTLGRKKRSFAICPEHIGQRPQVWAAIRAHLQKKSRQLVNAR